MPVIGPARALSTSKARRSVVPAQLDAAVQRPFLAHTNVRQFSRVWGCLELTKPRVTALVVLTAWASAYVAAGHNLPLPATLCLLAGTALVAGGTAALNQVFERHTDAMMRRTAARPIPSGRLRTPGSALFGSTLVIGGLAYLALGLGALTAVLALATSGIYLFVYTPLKRRSPISTVVGALPGAGPVLMGWAAARNSLGLGAWVLFTLQFLWQFPHFLAIARLYREDYERAGICMLPVIDREGSETGRQILFYTLALLPVSLLPGVIGLTGRAYIIGAVVLGLALLGVAIGSVIRPSRLSSRRLLQATVIYLPLIFALMIFAR